MQKWKLLVLMYRGAEGARRPSYLRIDSSGSLVTFAAIRRASSNRKSYAAAQSLLGAAFVLSVSAQCLLFPRKQTFAIAIRITGLDLNQRR